MSRPSPALLPSPVVRSKTMHEDSPEYASRTFDDLLQSMSKGELDSILDNVIAGNGGMTVEEYREKKALNQSLHEEGDAYRGLPPAEWPTLTFNWDFSPEGQRFGLDGVARQKFQEMHPNGLRLGYMPLLTFDHRLAHFSRRDTPEELWSLGSEFKLAKTIAYLRRGFPITPPIVAPTGSEVILKGGHHRYAIAKAVNLETIPFLVAPEEVKKIEGLVEVTWGMPA